MALFDHTFPPQIQKYFPKIFRPLVIPSEVEDAAKMPSVWKHFQSRVADGVQSIKESLKTMFMEAHTHEYTGLPNRRFFIKSLKEEFDNVRQNISQGGTVIFLDLDQLHAFNKNYGLDEGDRLLTNIAETIKQVIGMNDKHQNDVAAHFGGDEFAALITDAPDEKAKIIFEALKDSFNNYAYTFGGQSIPVKISMGMCHLNAVETPMTAIKNAADAMQADKAIIAKSRDAPYLA